MATEPSRSHAVAPERRHRVRLRALSALVLLCFAGVAGCRGQSGNEGDTLAEPTGLAYSVNPAVYAAGVAIAPNTPSAGGGAVASFSVSPALPSGLSLDRATGVVSGTPTTVTATATYTVTASNSAGSATVGLVITVNAAVTPPSGLAYSVNPALYTTGVAIVANTPRIGGGAVTAYSVSPVLPSGLSLDTATGVVSGTPTTVTATATYTVTASNSAGSATVGLVITVNAAVTPPTGLAYSVNPALYTAGVAIAPNTPSSGGGAVTAYSVSPPLPAGLGLGTTTGVITGTPASAAATATYTVTASNSAGSATVGLVITVNAAVTPPSGLAYSVNPALYTAGVAIAPNTPSSGGGAVTAYSVSPPLPAGLGLDITTGVITGTPASAAATATYTVTASNSAGSATVGLVITVNGGGGGAAPVLRLAASTWENYATASSMTTPAFGTQGAPRTLVAVVSWYPPHTDPWPTTLAWVGGPPAGATPWTMVVSSDFPVFDHPEYEHWRTEIWTSTTTSVLTNVQAVATRTNNDPRNPNDPSTGIFAVYEVAGAKAALGGIWYRQDWVVTSAVALSVTPTASNSLIIGASQYGDFYALAAANASTVIDYQQTDGGSDGGAAAWHNANATIAGVAETLGVTLPGGSTKAFSACAVELLAP